MQAYLDETDFYKMVIVLNTELTMGTGKVSAQVAHAAIGKFTLNVQWYNLIKRMRLQNGI